MCQNEFLGFKKKLGSGTNMGPKKFGFPKMLGQKQFGSKNSGKKSKSEQILDFKKFSVLVVVSEFSVHLWSKASS